MKTRIFSCHQIAAVLLLCLTHFCIDSLVVETIADVEDDEPPPPRRSNLVEEGTKSSPENTVHTHHNTKPSQNNPERQLLAPFDTDIRDDCRSLLEHCQSDVFAHVYLQCPALCTKYLEQEGMKGVVTSKNDQEALWEGTLRTISGRRIDADRFEGSVLVVALLPLLPGMAKYYYEMMETLHEKFQPKVEFVIIPIDVNEGIHIKPRSLPKVVILEEESAIGAHPWVKHLHNVMPKSGAASKDHNDQIGQLELPTDRLTVYLVSADGYFVERMTVPTMAALQKQIGLYLRTMDYHEL